MWSNTNYTDIRWIFCRTSNIEPKLCVDDERSDLDTGHAQAHHETAPVTPLPLSHRTESQTRSRLQERERIERDVAALQLLDRTLRDAQASAEARYLEPVTQKLRPHLSALFGDARLSLAGDFSLQTLDRAQGTESIAQLSAGKSSPRRSATALVL